MIDLDRDSPLPVSEQLVEQLRYQIASGRYRPGERLPSTRTLADQLGLSFHTTRKAYQRLAHEGLVDVRRGGGFRVRERPALSKAERMERGAAVVHEALQKLVGLGFSDEETEFVFEEQRIYAEPQGGRRKILFAAPYRELAESGAEQVTAVLQERADGVPLDALVRHADADVVVAPLPYLREAVMALPRAEAVGVIVGWPHDVLARVARLGEANSVALIVRQGDAVDPLTEMLRSRAGFPGTVYPLTTEADRPRLEGLIRRADLILYTPQVRRRVRPLLGDKAAAELAPVLQSDSLARLRETVGR